MIMMSMIVAMPMCVVMPDLIMRVRLHTSAILKQRISRRAVLFDPRISAVHDGMVGMCLQLRDQRCGHHEQHGKQSGPYRRGLNPARSSRPRHPVQARKGGTISFMI